ncbi:MAG TPA: TetR/AcrR family transcriptional regulator [Symbiobacteriaceae bacterium]
MTAIGATLVHTGLKLIAANGFEATSVDEITTAAGVAKGTFYNYFKTKEDLALAGVAQAQAEMVTRVEALIAAHPATRDRLQRLFDEIVTWVVANPEPAWIWGLEQLRRGRSDAYGASGVSQALIRIIEAGQAAGDVRTDRPSMLLSLELEGLFLAYLAAWKHRGRGRPFDLAEMMRLAVDDLLDGIGAGPLPRETR